ncbi:3-oxoacyl-[acyl-carrier protein] reductase [Aequoribacter fuscus]|uniref:3-oxoacyl-[acyl-carrier-protein] reductase n=1 Tax=Aequoribacter fuscus TaxID=2518989 RepID=F3L169_9GAMM|nr:3-oxoacyl-ACP reductase FabG [Aequoribacter fuscus]EGG30014.1 3-oxoacyl-[acyl-carrier protein] reductase [Aequoribacter fuscus]QHJ88001.1 3-oxoacyl-ACP reductase FabG [Aequoribacter fuscus]
MSEQKIALVTGASRGIGAAIADALVAAGMIVVGTATSEKGAAAIDDRLAASGGAGLVLNVTDEASVNACLEAIKARFGVATVLVNNAGITADNLLLRMKDDEWYSVVDTNLNALYRVCKGAVKGMTRARWGRIINVSSVVGRMGNAGQSNYAATKAGVEGFTRALARELGSRNITVNAVAPGFIETDMTDALGDDAKGTLSAQIPLGRLGGADEVAALVAFLASDGAAYITGETIQVNGGMYMG